MLTDKYLEKLLELYFNGDLSQEKKLELFESLRSNPSLNDTIQHLLEHTDATKAEQFLTEKALMCDITLIPEEDETNIELFLSGLMEPDEEEQFRQQLVFNNDLRTNTLAQAFLYKAIQKIKKQNEAVIESARQSSVLDVKKLFQDFSIEKDDALIDSYLSGNLSDEESKDFIARLNTDTDFRDRAAAMAMLSKSIRKIHVEDEKALNDAKKLDADFVGTLKPAAAAIAIDKPIDGPSIPAASRETPHVIPLWKNLRRIAAIIVVVLLVGVGYDYHNSRLTMEFANDGIAMASSDMQSESYTKGSENDSLISDLCLQINNVKEKKEIPATIKKLEGYYQSSTDEYADVEDNYVDQISIALATAYIYDNQKSKAKDVLGHIIADENSSKEAKEQAQKLLGSLNKTIIF